MNGEALRGVLALRDVEHAPRFGRRRGRLGLSGDGGTVEQQDAGRAERGEQSDEQTRTHRDTSGESAADARV